MREHILAIRIVFRLAGSTERENIYCSGYTIRAGVGIQEEREVGRFESKKDVHEPQRNYQNIRSRGKPTRQITGFQYFVTDKLSDRYRYQKNEDIDKHVFIPGGSGIGVEQKDNRQRHNKKRYGFPDDKIIDS